MGDLDSGKIMGPVNLLAQVGDSLVHQAIVGCTDPGQAATICRKTAGTCSWAPSESIMVQQAQAPQKGLSFSMRGHWAAAKFAWNPTRRSA